MPQTLATPVLQVDANVIHQVDTKNPDNLHSMWTVFAKCADAVAQGRRLENLSWRLWNRETFCCDANSRILTSNTTTLPQQIRQYSKSSSTESLPIPQLSGSVESVADEEAVDDFHSETPAMEIRPMIRRQDSCASSRSRGKERHITSDDLEKMVVKIIEAKEPLSTPLPDLVSSWRPLAAPANVCTPELERSGSTTSESSVTSSDAHSLESNQQASPPEMASSQTRPTIVIRGFSPSPSSLCRITSQAAKGPSPSAIPAPTAAPAARFVQPKGRTTRFTLGASSGDDSYSDRGSLDMRAQPVPQQPKRNMFQLGGSSEENSVESEQQPQQQQAQPKQQHVMDYANSSAIEDDDDDDAIYDESAIDDDDDSSEWEDSNEESGKSSIDSKLNFKRVDSSAKLASRRSLITLMLAQNDAQVQAQRNPRLASQSTSALPRTRLSPHRAQSSSPNDSDDAPLMMKRGVRAPLLNPINEVPRSAARPIMATATSSNHQTMLSPKTTRRNMLATELTESLRRHLVWERRQRSNPISAGIQRRYTSNDVANLKQFPEKPCMKDSQAVDATSYDMKTTEGYTGNSYYTHGW